MPPMPGDHVLKHFHILRVHAFRLDFQMLELALAAHRHADHAAAGLRTVFALVKLLLRLGHLFLELLRLPHQLLHVGAAAKPSSQK